MAGRFCVGVDPDHQGLRLICIPYAGGGSATFAGWQARLTDVNVVAVRLPGRESRLSDPPYRRLDPLVADLYCELEPLLRQPVVLFGHSLGGLVAFELARRCQREGTNIVRLIVSGCEAPPRQEPTRWLHRLPDQEFIAEIADLGGTPQEVLADRELLDIVVPVLRADYEVYETYCYQSGERLRCGIVACGGESDPEVCEHDLRRWQHHTQGSFALRLFSGGHFYLHQRREELLSMLGAELNAVNRGRICKLCAERCS